MLRLNNSATTTKNLKGWSYPLNKLGCLFRSGVYACFFKCFIYSCVVALDFCSKLQIIFSKDPLIITSAMWFIDFDWSDVEVHAPNLNSLNIYCLLEYWNMFWLLSPPPPHLPGVRWSVYAASLDVICPVSLLRGPRILWPPQRPSATAHRGRVWGNSHCEGLLRPGGRTTLSVRSAVCMSAVYRIHTIADN